MFSIQNHISDRSEEVLLGADFLRAIQGKERNVDQRIEELFYGVYKTHKDNTREFIRHIVDLVDCLKGENCDPDTIGTRALDFHATYAEILAPAHEYPIQASRDHFQTYRGCIARIAEQQAELHGLINQLVERLDGVVNQLVDGMACPIDFEPLTKAVILKCGHTFNEDAVLGQMQASAGKCAECAMCKKPFTGFAKDTLIRDVAKKVELLRKGWEGEEKDLQRAKMQINELSEMLTCSKTKRPLTQAVQGKLGAINEDASMQVLPPAYKTREVADLVQQLKESVENPSAK